MCAVAGGRRRKAWGWRLGGALIGFNVIVLVISASTPLPSAAADAVTAADIERIKVQAQGEHRQRVRQLKVAHPSDLLDWLGQVARSQGGASAPAPATPVVEPAPVTAPALIASPMPAKKNSPTAHVAPATTAAQTTRGVSRRAAPAPVTTIAPAKKTATPHYKIASVAFAKDQTRYGVRIDQWMRAELRHTLTSQDRAPVRLYLNEEVRGASKPIPAGTLFVGAHSFNTRTGRLFITLNTAHLPDGEQISIRASVYDQNKNYGLAGTVLDNLKERAGHGRQVAGRTLVDGLIDQALPASSSIAASTVKSGTKAIQSTREDIVAPDSYLVVEPQAVLINIEAGF